MSKINPNKNNNNTEELEKILEISIDSHFSNNDKSKNSNRQNAFTKRQEFLERSVQKVEAQGKRGKIKHTSTTQITMELLEYIQSNFEGYSLLVLSYIILGAIISLRRLLLNAFSDTDEFLNQRLGLSKIKHSKTRSKKLEHSLIKSENNNNDNGDFKDKTELTAENLRTLFNKSLVDELERFKSNKFYMSQNLFDKIQTMFKKMKINSMGFSNQDILKYEEEQIINPLFKQNAIYPTQKLPFIDNIKKMLINNQNDTNNFSNLVGVNVENIINPEGGALNIPFANANEIGLDNVNLFENSFDNNNIENAETPNNKKDRKNSKDDSKINFEYLTKSFIDDLPKEKNMVFWKKDKGIFELDIPTFLEVMKERENMTVADIKKAFHKNMDIINLNEDFQSFKDSLKPTKTISKLNDLSKNNDCDNNIKEIQALCKVGYNFYGGGDDLIAKAREINKQMNSSPNDMLRIENNNMDFSTSQKFDQIFNQSQLVSNDHKAKTDNPNNFDNILNDVNGDEENFLFSQMTTSRSEMEEKIGIEIVNELNTIIKKNTKFYQNVSMNSLVKKIEEKNNDLLRDYNIRQKNSFVFYNLLITCQVQGYNLQQNKLFDDFFFVKSQK